MPGGHILNPHGDSASPLHSSEALSTPFSHLEMLFLTDSPTPQVRTQRSPPLSKGFCLHSRPALHALGAVTTTAQTHDSCNHHLRPVPHENGRWRQGQSSCMQVTEGTSPVSSHRGCCWRDVRNWNCGMRQQQFTALLCRTPLTTHPNVPLRPWPSTGTHASSWVASVASLRQAPHLSR